MAHSTGNRSLRKPTPTPSLDGKLAAYSTAAMAAGVGLLALTKPAEAKVVYTASNTTIGYNQNVNIDLNNDGIADFNLSFWFFQDARLPEGNFGSGLTIYPIQAANQVWGVKTSKGWECAAALPGGVRVGAGAAFQQGYLDLFNAGGSYTRGVSDHCPWGEEHRGAFLGLKFVVNGQTHYGWAHITLNRANNSAVLSGYAYETVPNQAIDTGKTSGPVAALDRAALLGPQPATLGMLAQGSRGLSIWRREEEQA